MHNEWQTISPKGYPVHNEWQKIPLRGLSSAQLVRGLCILCALSGKLFLLHLISVKCRSNIFQQEYLYRGI